MKKRWILPVLASLAGCVHGGGTRISDAQLAAFQDGKTTVAEVVAALGQPTSDVRSSDGFRVLGYGYMRAETSGAAFIPVVGAFAASASGQIRNVTLIFDKAGVMTQYSVMDSQFGR